MGSDNGLVPAALYVNQYYSKSNKPIFTNSHGTIWHGSLDHSEYNSFWPSNAIWHNVHQWISDYHQNSYISHTLVGIIIVNHSDVIGASPVVAAPTTSSFST